MNIFSNLLGHVKIEDDLDVGDVESSSGDICCHQNVMFPLLNFSGQYSIVYTSFF